MVDLSKYKEEKPNQIRRIVWMSVGVSCFRMLYFQCFKTARNFILKCFGMKENGCSLFYSNCKIYAPWNLEIGECSCVGPYVEIYNKAKIIIGNNVVISQYAYLCTASHSITSPRMCLVAKPIVIDNGAWICAKAIILPGVTIGEGAVVAAGAVVTKDVEPWTVVGGNPAVFIKKREISG